MSERYWKSHRRSAERCLRKAAIELSIACGSIMPHPEVASMAAAREACEGILKLLELTSPEPQGHTVKVVKLLSETRSKPTK